MIACHNVLFLATCDYSSLHYVQHTHLTPHNVTCLVTPRPYCIFFGQRHASSHWPHTQKYFVLLPLHGAAVHVSQTATWCNTFKLKCHHASRLGCPANGLPNPVRKLSCAGWVAIMENMRACQPAAAMTSHATPELRRVRVRHTLGQQLVCFDILCRTLQPSVTCRALAYRSALLPHSATPPTLDLVPLMSFHTTAECRLHKSCGRKGRVDW